MSTCTGNEDDHCCYFGEPCQYLEEYTVIGRHWCCQLKRIYGTWDAVYTSEEWSGVLANAMAHGLPAYYKCGDWPYEGEVCGTCGLVGVTERG